MTDKILAMTEDAIKKCQTHAHKAKSLAGDLRKTGFSGENVAELIYELEDALKFAHLYQGYINVVNCEGDK